MSIKINFLLFVIIAFLFSFSLNAVEVKDLYQASLPINSQSNSDREGAFKKALSAVMIKVGGEKSVLENDVIKKSLNNYRSYLSQYHYQQKLIQLADDKTNKKQLFLFASFNEEKINQLFQEANLPLWGSLRPQVLLWLVNEDGLKRSVISNSSTSSLPFSVNEFSIDRGLPIMMPLMDLTDATQVKVSDLWGRFQQPIKAASSRYLAEAIVVMRLSNSSLVTPDLNHPEATEAPDCGLLCEQSQLKARSYVLDWSLLDWSLIKGQQQLSTLYTGEDPNILLQKGLADITELIYQRYALSTSSQKDFEIEVGNVDSLETYVEVFDFLSDLSSVKAVTLQQAKGSARRFNLQLLGSEEAFLASLKLNKKLRQFIDPLAQFNEPIFKKDSDTLTPIFHWVK